MFIWKGYGNIHSAVYIDPHNPPPFPCLNLVLNGGEERILLLQTLPLELYTTLHLFFYLLSLKPVMRVNNVIIREQEVDSPLGLSSKLLYVLNDFKLNMLIDFISHNTSR